MIPTLETIIQFGDCDEAGIVFYPRYFYWMDSAFQGLLRTHGWNQRKLRSMFGTLGTPLVKATANFLAPATYDDALTVAAGISRWGNSSFEIAYKGAVGGRAGFRRRGDAGVDGADGRPSEGRRDPRRLPQDARRADSEGRQHDVSRIACGAGVPERAPLARSARGS